MAIMSRRFARSDDCKPHTAAIPGWCVSARPQMCNAHRSSMFHIARNDDLTWTLPMASIHKDIPIDAHPDDVWAAVRDFGAVHRRLAPGFVIDARLEGDARIVTFHNGTVAREVLVDCDDARRRLVYA